MNIRLSLPLLSLLMAVSASAQEHHEHESSSGWTVIAGAMGVSMPRYMGSDETHVVPEPFGMIDYNDMVGFQECRLLDRSGSFYFRPVHKGPWSLGVLLMGQESGRRETEAKALKGMGNRGAGMFGGLEMAFKAESFSASLEIHKGLKDQAGILAGLNLGTSFRLGERFSLEFGVTGVWGDRDYMNWEFGITPLQAAKRQALIDDGNIYLRAKDALPYTPKSGFRGIDGSAMLQWNPAEKWMAFAMVQSGRLLGDAGDSPLTRSKNQTIAAIGLAHQFAGGGHGH